MPVPLLAPCPWAYPRQLTQSDNVLCCLRLLLAAYKATFIPCFMVSSNLTVNALQAMGPSLLSPVVAGMPECSFCDPVLFLIYKDLYNALQNHIFHFQMVPCCVVQYLHFTDLQKGAASLSADLELIRCRSDKCNMSFIPGKSQSHLVTVKWS